MISADADSGVFLSPDNLTNQIEFDEIIRYIAQFCQSAPGFKSLTHYTFSSSRGIILNELSFCSELKNYLLSGKSIIIDDFSDLSEKVARLSVEGFVLNIGELVDLLLFLKNFDALFTEILKNKDKLQLTYNFFSTSGFDKKCLSLLGKVISEEGFVKDTASHKLQEVRQQIRTLEHQSEEAFEKILHQARNNDWLSEEEQSIRKGERVLAIKSKYRKSVKGIYVDESGSGKTVFIQPLVVLEFQNRILRLKQEESAEIQRIIRNLCQQLAPYSESISGCYRCMIKLDTLIARAKFAVKFQCNQPVLTEKPVLRLEKAYHPLLLIKNTLKNRETIPLSLSLDHEKRIMIISGPNAGGKTIALKTLCLIQLSLMAGIPVPAEPQSEIFLFPKIITDIADNQSIDNELSTYSARLKIYRQLLQSADHHTLFLLDEFGSGTDPQAGGAVAEAVLEKLAETRAFGCVATHFSNLKNLASAHKTMINAAMLFDNQTLMPSFRLETGRAGSSYTFEIMKQAGFDEKFIQTVKAKGTQQLFLYDKIIQDLTSEKKETIELKSRLEKSLEETAKMLAEYRSLRDKYKKMLSDYKSDRNEKTRRYLEDLKRHFEKLIHQWQREKDEKLKSRKSKEILRKIAEKQRVIEEKPEKEMDREEAPLVAGDWAQLKGSGQSGMIESINKGIATLLFDNQRIKVSLSSLVRAQKTPQQPTAVHHLIRDKSA